MAPCKTCSCVHPIINGEPKDCVKELAYRLAASEKSIVDAGVKVYGDALDAMKASHDLAVKAIAELGDKVHALEEKLAATTFVVPVTQAPAAAIPLGPGPTQPTVG